LVIGLTILGLDIAFVTNFLGQADDSVRGRLTEDDITKIEQVQRESGNFAFLSSTLNLIKGQEAKLYIKVRNPTGGELAIFNGGTIPSTGDFSVSIIQAAGSPEAGFTVQGPPINLAAGEQNGYPLIVSAGDA